MIINTDFSPDGALKNIREVFRNASADTGHNLRFFSVATCAAESGMPASRMVVLRDFLPDWSIRFYTDFRSSKVRQIQNNSSVALLFWNPEERYQIRVKANATIHYQNEVAESNWQHVGTEDRKAYSSKPAPGSEISGPGEARNRKDCDHFFCVVDALPLQIKLLQLNRQDHFAMKFVRESPAREWHGTWIVP